MNRRTLVFLVLLFGVTLALRLSFIYGADTYSADGYYYLRLIEHVAFEGEPLAYDELSYGGRVVLSSPLFLYLMAFLYWLFKAPFILQLAPQLFVSSLPLVVFFIVRTMTQRFDAAFFSALLSAFVPVVFSWTLFSLSPLTLSLPLSFLLLLLFTRTSSSSSAVPFIIVMVALSLTHPSSILPLTGLLFYLGISRLAGFRVEKSELELIFFSTFFLLWVHFLLYKRAFLVHGLAFIHQNIPLALLSRYFTDISLSTALLQIGVYPLLGGVYAISKYLFRTKDKSIFPFLSLSIAIALFLWFRFITPAVGFMYLGVCLSILSGPAYLQLVSYVEKTKFSRYSPVFIGVLFILIIPTLVVPSMYFASGERAAVVSPALADALDWLRGTSSPDDVVLASPGEGFVVESVAARKTVMDTSFLLAPDASLRLKEVERMFMTSFPTEAVALFNKYGVDYILVSPQAHRRFDVDKSLYSIPCLQEVYNKRNVVIYRSRCKLSVTPSVI